MNDPSSSPSIHELVAQAARHVRWAALALGGALTAAWTLGVWLALCVADNLLRLPSGLRLPLAAAAVLAFAVLVTRRLVLPALRRPSPARVALLLERRYGVPHNLVINALQFEGAALRPEEELFSHATIVQSQDQARRFRLADLWDRRRLSRWGAAGIAAVLMGLLYAVLFPRHAANATLRLACPLADIPPVGAVTLRISPAADLVIGEGDDLRVVADLEGGGGGREAAPGIVWREKAGRVEEGEEGAESAPMTASAQKARRYEWLFRDVRRTFAFRVVAGDAASRSVRIEVRPLPAIVASVFRVAPPDYTGAEPSETPGPPAPLAVLPGSRVTASLAFEPPVLAAEWLAGSATNRLTARHGTHTVEVEVTNSLPYAVDVLERGTGRRRHLLRGEIALQADRPPRVDFLTTDRNRFVNPGADLPLEIEAGDDFGVRTLAVTVRGAEGEGAPREAKAWSYVGPPGNAGPVRETLRLAVDPAAFKPGVSYILEAVATDFAPGGHRGVSRPLVLRVRAVDELAVPAGDPLEKALALLRETAEAQRRAVGLTENAEVNLEDVLARKSLGAHRAAMSNQQEKARSTGGQALTAFKGVEVGKPYAVRLRPLLEGEMPWVLGDIGGLETNRVAALPVRFGAIRERQVYILKELLTLLGAVADARKDAGGPGAVAKAPELPPAVTPEQAAEELKDDLDQFTDLQRKIIEKTRTLLDKAPEDLTEEEQKILGELAREEAKWASFFEEKLTDYSKLPLQDFADGSLAEEFNELYMEVHKAAKSLYEKNVELAVPTEQSGLENAEEIVQNLERWLANKPDNLKWNMEEPLAPTDVNLAELPSELEDIVGELLDKEEEMGDDVEDVSSSWLDSMDKGVGWDAMDGPISDMSAKGVTGNQLPNQMEIGGRSGEGRTGRSQGQMVEATAEGKKGRETPTRLSPSPFEQGSVEDKSTESPGGATGGGKLSGFAGEGLRGPTPPPQLQQKMARLAGQQAGIRQEAEALAYKLRAYHLPSGDLETSIGHMKRVEDTLRKGYGPGLRQVFSRAVDSLEEAQEVVRAQTGLRREESRLPRAMRDEIAAGLQDGTPAGYEEMIGAYFRNLAEQRE
jgi:hypothetical protein